MTNVSDRSVLLPDGRRLAYHEFGDPDGIPCVYTPGWPASGLAGQPYGEAARKAGVRWISIDKPGTGRSDFDPRRSLPRYAEDIREFADRLGLDRFATVGESGGGPHALALARALGDRLTVAVILSGMAPGQGKQAREGMRPVNRRLFALAERAPWLLRPQLAMFGRMVAKPENAAKWQQAAMGDAPEAERRALEDIDPALLLAATGEALRDGGRAAAQELRMLVRPWGFPLSGCTCPVEVWHGAEDRNAPVAHAHRLVAALPGCRARIVEGAGHSVGMVVQHELMATIARAGTPGSDG
ncbi:alpha/beta fold hydrolase [Amycolatopsis anabasis]|uniref:alpha/beta fold hydrolase n=1 Tax=Amycolatopsis anabasis TaxID=1840409 RepID=UPI00131BDA6C|nr:alpha/beta hydrolase [Amycolatopsis anabasis]